MAVSFNDFCVKNIILNDNFFTDSLLSPVNSSSISTSVLNSVPSPKASPTINPVDGITTISDIDDDDKNNNNSSINKDSSDENCENDTISVTGSPEHTSNSVDIEDDRKSPPTTGAFTSLIHKNGSNSWRHHKYNSELLPQFTHSNQSAFNQAALAAQLFLQNPLIPSSSQWLYNQLYGNQQEFPWFRHTFLANNTQNTLRPVTLNDTNAPDANGTGINLSNKRPFSETTTAETTENDRKSPISVSSTKKSPSPEPRNKLKKKSISSTDTKRGSDVWRPY